MVYDTQSCTSPSKPSSSNLDQDTEVNKPKTPIWSLSLCTYCTGSVSILIIYKVTIFVEPTKIKKPIIIFYSFSSLFKNKRLSITKFCGLCNVHMTVPHSLLMKCLASSCATLLSISYFSVIPRPLPYRTIAIFHFQKQLYEVQNSQKWKKHVLLLT